MRAVFIIFILFGLSFICVADVVNTKDGDSYEGVITEVSIRTQDGDVYTFSREDISSIEMGGEEEYEEEVPEEELIEEPEEEAVEETEVEEEVPKETKEEEKGEEPSPEKKPLIIGPQIKGLDEDRYKTY